MRLPRTSVDPARSPDTRVVDSFLARNRPWRGLLPPGDLVQRLGGDLVAARCGALPAGLSRHGAAHAPTGADLRFHDLRHSGARPGSPVRATLAELIAPARSLHPIGCDALPARDLGVCTPGWHPIVRKLRRNCSRCRPTVGKLRQLKL